MTIIDELKRGMALSKSAGHFSTPVHHHVLALLIEAYEAGHTRVVPFPARKSIKRRDVMEIAE